MAVYLNNSENSNRDKVRLLIGDRSEVATELSDNEIDTFLVDANDDTTLAAIYACDALIAIYGAKVSKKISDQSINYSDLQEHYIKLGERLKKRYESYNYGTPSPTSGSTDVDARFTSDQFNYE